MPAGYRTYKINDFIKKNLLGEVDLDTSIKLIREIATATEIHHDYNLLIDVRQAVPLKNFTDLLTIAAEFTKFKGVLRNKIAFIIPNEPSRIERARFFIKSLDEVSFQIKYFTEYEEAIEWFSIVEKYPKNNT